MHATSAREHGRMAPVKYATAPNRARNVKLQFATQLGVAERRMFRPNISLGYRSNCGLDELKQQCIDATA